MFGMCRENTYTDPFLLSGNSSDKENCQPIDTIQKASRCFTFYAVTIPQVSESGINHCIFFKFCTSVFSEVWQYKSVMHMHYCISESSKEFVKNKFLGISLFSHSVDVGLGPRICSSTLPDNADITADLTTSQESLSANILIKQKNSSSTLRKLCIVFILVKIKL